MGGNVPEEEVALRDGSRVLIRAVQPADKALFAESWEHFGEESRYRRFLGASRAWAVSRRSNSMLALFEEVGEVQVHERGMGQIEIDVELPCDRERGLADALRAAAKGLVRLRP